jgi:hypothetical protein
MNIPKLSHGALAAICEIKPIASAADPENRKEWVMAHARSMSAGLRLVQFEIDEIGISLKHGWITPEQAANDLAALEQVPIRVAAVFYRGDDPA